MDHERWNDLLLQFLEELAVQVPDERGVPAVVLMVNAAKLFDVAKPCAAFVGALGAHEDLVTARDPALFSLVAGALPGVDLARVWARAGEQARPVIFDYVCALYLAGKALLST